MSIFAAVERFVALRILGLGPGSLRYLAGPPKTSPEGFELDLQTQVIIRLGATLGHTGWSALGPERARRAMDRSCRVLRADPEGALAIDEISVPVGGATIDARRYKPLGIKGPLPLIVFYHGGGFVMGSLDSHDGELRALALAVPAIVLSVDYRLAPEHRFPTAVDDGLAAFRFAASRAESWGADPARMAVMGDSAGGNLAAVIARETRTSREKPVFQLLIYPATDLTRKHASHKHFATGYFLEKTSIDWFLESYLRSPDDVSDPRASPLLDGQHRFLPPAFVMTAGFDPLRDEGRAYAEALARSGVAVEHVCYEGLVHGFWNMTAGVTAAHKAFEDAVFALQKALAPR